MAGGDLALGIDIGTSGVRIAALDASGCVEAIAATKMEVPVRNGDRIEQDAKVWWQALVSCFADLRRTLDLARVRALAVDGTSGTIVAIDGAGTPLAPARLYNDAGAGEEARLIAAHGPRETAAHGASSPLGRAMQLAKLPRVQRILHQADWIAGRLSGRFDVSDENNALKTGYDPVSRSWPDWIDHLGLDRGLLPTVVPIGQRTGTVTRATTEALGLGVGTIVVAGTTDGCASFLATGAARPGEGVTALGTTLTLKQLLGSPIFAPEYGLYSHRLGDLWLAGGASNSGGAVLKQFFDDAALAALAGRLDPEQPTGLDYYPLAARGERFPINDPSLEPRVAPRPKDDAVFLQGLLEGIAGIEKLGYDRLRELGAPPLLSVRNTGGGARNNAWSRIRERMLGVPLLPAASEEAAVGTARLAWQGLGREVAPA